MAEKPRRRPPPPPPKPRKPEMTEPKGSTETVFEINRIRRLVELMKEHDLSEIDLRESRHRIRICRGPREAARPAYAPPPPPPPPFTGASQAAAGQAAPADSANTVTIKSPMVGTYYSKPNPKAEAFVKVGSKVDVNTPIC